MKFWVEAILALILKKNKQYSYLVVRNEKNIGRRSAVHPPIHSHSHPLISTSSFSSVSSQENLLRPVLSLPFGRMRDCCRPTRRRQGRVSSLPATKGRGEPEAWCSVINDGE
jgi:hypothetical protein